MRNLKTTGMYRLRQADGFSLIEMMIVVAISIVVSTISVMSLVPLMKAQRVTNAYNITLAALRQARDNAVSQRTSYSVTFSSSASPNTITVSPVVNGFQGDQSTVVYTLPTDVSFMTQTQFSSMTAPDSGGGSSFGTGTRAIDFGYTAAGGTGNQSTVYFCPDGSAQSAACAAGGYSNNWDNGVVYISRTGELLNSRAITLWGGTGRVRGWRIYGSGSSYQWVRQ